MPPTETSAAIRYQGRTSPTISATPPPPMMRHASGSSMASSAASRLRAAGPDLGAQVEQREGGRGDVDDQADRPADEPGDDDRDDEGAEQPVADRLPLPEVEVAEPGAAIDSSPARTG